MPKILNCGRNMGHRHNSARGPAVAVSSPPARILVNYQRQVSIWNKFPDTIPSNNT